MNTERLHTVAKAVRADISATGTDKELKALVAALQTLSGQPGDANAQQQVSATRQRLASSLHSAKSNTFAPTWQQVVDEIGATEILGRELAARIDQVFARNGLTPAVAQAEIQALRDQVQANVTALDGLLASFKGLGIGAEELEPGHAELGILVPRDSVKNELGLLGKEIREIDGILGVFSEVATGSRPAFDIRAISTTDVSLFLAAVPPVAACIASAVQKVLTGYKTLLEIRKLRADVAAQNVPEAGLKGIDDYANEIMEKTIKAAVPELLKEFYKGTEKGRHNELAIELGGALSKIAMRIDRGYHIEVRITPGPASDPASAEAKAEAHYVELVRGAADTLQFLKIEGPPILSLPESTQDAEAQAEKKPKGKP